MTQWPANMPTTTSEAFARIGALKDGGATIDDLKVLALVESIGKALYDDLAAILLEQRLHLGVRRPRREIVVERLADRFDQRQHLEIVDRRPAVLERADA
ncbi:MAG: hypothetical protein EOP61_40030, partial [Sphingomonadales bacterium]